ncbi:MAG: hypothetical protein U1E81_20830 [Xanthobacteraceae bacterium]
MSRKKKNLAGRSTMATIESTPRRLVLQSGSTTLTLDKEGGKVSMQRKVLFWSRAPIEKGLAEIADATVDTAVDRSSGVEVCNTMLISRAGEGWAFPADDKRDAESTARQIKEFLGLA